jgi:hypothetical protein
MACGTPVLTSNEAFRAILPEPFAFAARDLGEFTAKARAILTWEPSRRRREGEALRALVVRDHAVAPLVERLVAEMETGR